MQRDVWLAEGFEAFTVSSFDGPEDGQHHLSVVVGVHEHLLLGPSAALVP
jgi:hypothetical protein